MNDLLPFLLGVAVSTCLIIGAFFVRFWKRTGDNLFLLFAAAFGLFAVNWTVVSFIEQESYPAVYLFRLLGFGLIIAGVVGKNRGASRGQP